MLPNLVEQIDLCVGITRVAGMPEQQLNQTHKSIERVEALHSNACHHLARLRQRSVAQVDTHFRAQAEKARYQVVRLEDAVEMHLSTQNHISNTR